MEKLKKFLNPFWGIIIIMILSTILILPSISNSMLWKDEAITSQIGYNTLKYGYPSIWDGKNLISSTDGNSFNSILVSSNYEWLQFYIVAASIAIFGKTTFAARAPFAILSILSVFVIWKIAKRIYNQSWKQNLCSLLYLLNTQFLLYAGQARYYSLVLLFSSLSILFFLKLHDRMSTDYQNKQPLTTQFKHAFLGFKNLDTCLFTLSISLAFHSNRVSGAALVLALLGYMFIKRVVYSIQIGLPMIVGAATWGIWYIVNSIILKAPSFGTDTLESHFFTKFLMCIWKIHTYFFPIITLGILYVLFRIIFSKQRTIKEGGYHTCLFFLLIVSNILVVSLPRWGIINHYFVLVLISAPFITFRFIEYFYRNSKILTPIILLLIFVCNIFSIWPYYLLPKDVSANNEVNNLLSANYTQTTNYGIISSPSTNSDFRIESLNDYKNKLSIRSYLYDYCRTLGTYQISYLDELINLLNQKARPDETIAFLGVEFEPIMYYTDLRVVNNMSTKLRPWSDYFSSYPNQEKFEHLTYVPDGEIDWIVFKNDGFEYTMLDNPNFVKENIQDFEIFYLEQPDVPLSNTADLDYHFFETPTTDKRVIVYHRIK